MKIIRQKAFTGCISPINVSVSGYGTFSLKNGETKSFNITEPYPTIEIYDSWRE